MKLEEVISEGIKDAMKSKDAIRRDILRSVKKYIIELKTSAANIDTVTDEDVLKIITKLAKQGVDSAEVYKSQNREDLYDYEMAQVKVLKEFLPEQLSDEGLTSAVKTIIEKIGASSMKDMGKVMGVASKELAGKADGRDISAKVKELLA